MSGENTSDSLADNNEIERAAARRNTLRESLTRTIKACAPAIVGLIAEGETARAEAMRAVVLDGVPEDALPAASALLLSNVAKGAMSAKVVSRRPTSTETRASGVHNDQASAWLRSPNDPKSPERIAANFSDWGAPLLPALARLVEHCGEAASRRIRGVPEEEQLSVEPILDDFAMMEFEQSLNRGWLWREAMKPLWAAMPASALAGWVRSRLDGDLRNEAFTMEPWAEPWLALWEKDEAAAAYGAKTLIQKNSACLHFFETLLMDFSDRNPLAAAPAGSIQGDGAAQALARQEKDARLALLCWSTAEIAVERAGARQTPNSHSSRKMITLVEGWRSLCASQAWLPNEAVNVVSSSEDSLKKLALVLDPQKTGRLEGGWASPLAEWLVVMAAKITDESGRLLLADCRSGKRGELWREIANSAWPVFMLSLACSNRKADVSSAKEALGKIKDAGGFGELWGWRVAFGARFSADTRLHYIEQDPEGIPDLVKKNLDGWSLEQLRAEQDEAWRLALQLPAPRVASFLSPRRAGGDIELELSEAGYAVEFLSQQQGGALSDRRRALFAAMMENLERRGWSPLAQENGLSLIRQLKEDAGLFLKVSGQPMGGYAELVADLERRELVDAMSGVAVANGEGKKNGSSAKSFDEAEGNPTRGAPRL
jgi:hypothetical protein